MEELILKLAFSIAKYCGKKKINASFDNYAATKVSQDILTKVQSHAKVVSTASLANAVPGGSAVAITAVVASTWKMYYDINQSLGISFSDNFLESTASGIVSNLASNSAAAVGTNLLSFIPGIGTIGAIAGGAVINRASLYGAAVAYLKILQTIVDNGGDFSESSFNSARSEKRPVRTISESDEQRIRQKHQQSMRLKALNSDAEICNLVNKIHYGCFGVEDKCCKPSNTFYGGDKAFLKRMRAKYNIVLTLDEIKSFKTYGELAQYIINREKKKQPTSSSCALQYTKSSAPTSNLPQIKSIKKSDTILLLEKILQTTITDPELHPKGGFGKAVVKGLKNEGYDFEVKEVYACRSYQDLINLVEFKGVHDVKENLAKNSEKDTHVSNLQKSSINNDSVIQNAGYATKSATLTSKEKDYIQEVKECMQDGEISERERRLLEKIRILNGISEERAKELELSLKNTGNTLTENELSLYEKEYFSEFKEVYEKGPISEKERRLLDKLSQIYEISKERALEIESIVKKSEK